MCEKKVIENERTQSFKTDKPLSHHLCFSKKAFRYILAIIPICVLLLFGTSYQPGEGKKNFSVPPYTFPGVEDSLKAILADSKPDGQLCIYGERTAMLSSVRINYLRNGYKPVWISYDGINKMAENLVTLLEHAREYGLEPDNYHITVIHEMQQKLADVNYKSRQASLSVRMDVLLTDAAFKLMVNLHSGYQVFDSALFASTWVTGLPDLLLNGLAHGKVTENILSVQPQFIEYTRLQKASENFVRNSQLTEKRVKIDFPTKDTALLHAQVYEALVNLGYITADGNHGNLTDALRKFQYHRGLIADGKLGINTIEALQQTTMYEYKVLALNLDRLRKKENTDANLIFVNIPAYHLKVYNGNTLMDTFRVIVGQPKTQTPLLTAKMVRVIANPAWYVPRSIAMNEILPRLKSDSGYLKRNNMKVLDKNHRVVDYESLDMKNMSEKDFNYTVKQDGGLDNSLGQVKFIFPNPYSVYLHDTPAKSLFLKDLRAFSHGCVRVQNPERLASYILNDLNNVEVNVPDIIKSKRPREFEIQTGPVVQIMYLTCEANDKGELFFFKDIYDNDKKELEKLTGYMGI